MADEQEHFQNSLYREVNEDLREEQLKKFWNKYGLIIIVTVVAVISGAVSFEGWKAWRDKVRQQETNEFANALSIEKKQDRIKALEEIVSKSNTGIRDLAKFELVGLDDEKSYLDIANNDSVNGAYRDLAKLKYVMKNFKDLENQKIIDMISPLADYDNEWHGQALEILGAVEIRKNNINAARELYTKISDDRNVPKALKTRANEMLYVLGGKIQSQNEIKKAK